MRSHFFRSAMALLLAPFCASSHEWDTTWTGSSTSVSGPAAHYVDARPLVARPSWILEDRGRMTRVAPHSGQMLTRVTDAQFTGSQILRNLADGGVIVNGLGQFLRFDATGQLLWHFNPDIGFGAQFRGGDLGIDDRGSLWYIDGDAQLLHKLGAEGQRAVTHSAPDLNLRLIKSVAVSPTGRSALVVGIGGSADEPVIASARLAGNGAILSTWTGPPAGDSRQDDFFGVAIDDENLFVVALDAGGRLLVARHEADGAVALPQQPDPLISHGGIDYIATTSQGFTVVSAHGIPISQYWQELHFFSASGHLVSTHRLEDFNFIDARTTVEGDDGALWAIARRSDFAGTTLAPALYRLTPSGGTRIILPDDTNADRAFIATTPSAGQIMIAQDDRLFRLDNEGTITPLLPYSVVTIPTPRVMGTTTSDGTSYVMTRADATDGAPAGAAINRIARDGSLQWRVPVPQGLRFDTGLLRFDSRRIAANADRLCYYAAPNRSVYCHRASNGDLMMRIELPEGRYDALMLDDDSRVLLYRFLGGAMPVVVVDADYSLLPANAYSAAMLAPGLHHLAGHELYFDADAETSTRSVRRSAQVLEPAAPTVTWNLGSTQTPARQSNGQPAAIALADGSALLLAFDGAASPTSLTLRKLNADGTLGYLRHLGGIVQQAHLALAGDRVLVATHRNANSVEAGESRLIGIALADGAIVWQHSVVLPAPRTSTSPPRQARPSSTPAMRMYSGGRPIRSISMPTKSASPMVR
jgi:outer membrane protein assembly factor BamB